MTACVAEVWYRYHPTDISGTTHPLRAVPSDRYNGTIGAIFSDGTGEVYLGLPEGIVKVFSLGNGRFAISLVGAVIINDLHVDMAREICKDLNTKESRVRYSVGFEPAFSKTGISITCDFEEDGDDETTENEILSYTKTYLEPKQQELQTIWTQKMEKCNNTKI